jgi:hypothetical protein
MHGYRKCKLYCAINRTVPNTNAAIAPNESLDAFELSCNVVAVGPTLIVVTFVVFTPVVLGSGDASRGGSVDGFVEEVAELGGSATTDDTGGGSLDEDETCDSEESTDAEDDDLLIGTALSS